MKTFVPSYYPEFACIKGECRHSCCIGWEIDIDENTRGIYKNIGGDIGRRLADNIVDAPDGAHFRMDKNRRCPFLNGCGLCDIIISLGKDHLCEICDDHPRYRNFFSDRTELGLGLCCEAAGELILSMKEPAGWLLIEDDGEEEFLYEEEADVLELREELTEIMQDRSRGVETRVDAMLEAIEADMPPRSIKEWAEFFKGLERLDECWTDRLESISEAAVPTEWDTPFEQLMVYLLWRHLPAAAEDGDIDGRILLCIVIWKLMRAMFAAGEKTLEELADIARMCSSEIEYSDENIAAIIEDIHNA